MDAFTKSEFIDRTKLVFWGISTKNRAELEQFADFLYNGEAFVVRDS
jgi:hypothetical protein